MAISDYLPIRHDNDADADAEDAARFIPRSPTPSSSEGDTDARPTEKPAERAPAARRRRARNAGLVVAALLVLGLSNVASLAVGAFAGRRAVLAGRGSSLDRACAAHTATFSPLLRDVAITYGAVAFNGTFMDENVYRRPGAPDVDAAWEALGVDYRAGVIAAADGAASGLTAGHVQRAERYGGGFFVNVEGMHHLHCLNLVRKAAYYNYDYYKALGMHAFKNNDGILRRHVSHCIDTLRQVLMCNVDTAVLGQVWYRTADTVAAFPDFHTTHTCKNYDAVRRWAEQLQAPPNDELPDDYMQPADPAFVWPSMP